MHVIKYLIWFFGRVFFFRFSISIRFCVSCLKSEATTKAKAFCVRFRSITFNVKWFADFVRDKEWLRWNEVELKKVRGAAEPRYDIEFIVFYTIKNRSVWFSSRFFFKSASNDNLRDIWLKLRSLCRI